VGSVIVTGPPGVGKTTIARLLAESRPPGVHLDSDAFWHMISSTGYISPWLADANHQNGVVLDAVAQAALAFDAGGYQLVIDGIVGPWFLDRFSDIYTAAGRPLDYVVLRTTLETAIARVAAREGQPTIDAEAVSKMHRAFADIGRWETHVVSAEQSDARSALAAICEMRDRGLLAV
jgi:adenylate kinase family enzyme